MTLKYEVILYKHSMHYRRHGLRHKVGNPSTIYSSGQFYWYQYGKRHRLDGPASVMGLSVIYYFKDVACTKAEYESKIPSSHN